MTSPDLESIIIIEVWLTLAYSSAIPRSQGHAEKVSWWMVFGSEELLLGFHKRILTSLLSYVIAFHTLEYDRSIFTLKLEILFVDANGITCKARHPIILDRSIQLHVRLLTET